MTNEELKRYENRLYELKELSRIATINIKFYPRVNRYKEDLIRYAKEIKHIQKILKKAKKIALKNGI